MLRVQKKTNKKKKQKQNSLFQLRINFLVAEVFNKFLVFRFSKNAETERKKNEEQLKKFHLKKEEVYQ